MKTNGLRNKKKAMARAAWRIGVRKFEPFTEGPNVLSYMRGLLDSQIDAVDRWNRAAKGRQ
jgi:hypothetical protein